MSSVDSMTEDDLAALHELQVGLCDEPMTRHEMAAFWAGFPPTSTVVNPMNYDAEQRTPIEAAAVYLEQVFGSEPSVVALTSTFDKNASNIADLVVNDPAFGPDRSPS